jgi:hypothetical protein
VFDPGFTVHYIAPMSLTRVKEQISAFSELAEYKTWSARDEELESMERLYDDIDHTSREGIVLCFTLAKIYHDLDDVDKSFSMLVEGNRHHKVGKTDTIEDARATIHAVRKLFSSQSVKRLATVENRKLIFIVGMPRSGTTLVEQILSSHSHIYGGGELKLIGQWCFGFVKLYRQHGDAALLDNYLQQLREHYLQGLEALTDKPGVTDKMPVNFLWIGFILSAFPGAKVIHTVRDPMAVCWSIFKTPFAGTSNGYACDLEDIGEFYTLYRDLMNFWHDRFPGEIYDLNYERLTERQREETTRLLEYCDLPWEDACMEFHNNPREVTTVSANQVRKPMYQGSSEVWKPYERYLQPLMKTLNVTKTHDNTE